MLLGGEHATVKEVIYNYNTSSNKLKPVFIAETRMLFSGKRTIRITHRSQKNILNRRIFLSFEIDMTFKSNSIDLQMTLVEYKNIVEPYEL